MYFRLLMLNNSFADWVQINRSCAMVMARKADEKPSVFDRKDMRSSWVESWMTDIFQTNQLTYRNIRIQLDVTKYYMIRRKCKKLSFCWLQNVYILSFFHYRIVYSIEDILAEYFLKNLGLFDIPNVPQISIEKNFSHSRLIISIFVCHTKIRFNKWIIYPMLCTDA